MFYISYDNKIYSVNFIFVCRTEEGWGEFEAAIEIYFHDPDEAPINLVHMIKLHPPGKGHTVFNIL
jgi:transcription initiation factor IIF auxiliary subunit